MCLCMCVHKEAPGCSCKHTFLQGLFACSSLQACGASAFVLLIGALMYRVYGRTAAKHAAEPMPAAEQLSPPTVGDTWPRHLAPGYAMSSPLHV